ncbi:MAG: ATP synthase subunit I [Desulfobacteraceae bacterium]|nr:ATP synthase subunit I [Desulfobacteraceae bacterium]
MNNRKDDIQKRLLDHVNILNVVLFFIASTIGLYFTPPDFFRGIIFGGLIVTINFYLLARTLKRALTPPNLSSHQVVLFKYYVRFFITGIIIFFLILMKIVDAVGLVIGLSTVVASISFATMIEFKKLIFKEAM